MFEVIAAVLALATVAIGVKVFLKFREISSWKPEEESKRSSRAQALPTELRDLKIEDPNNNLDDLSDDHSSSPRGESGPGSKTE